MYHDYHTTHSSTKSSYYRNRTAHQFSHSNKKNIKKNHNYISNRNKYWKLEYIHGFTNQRSN